MKYTYKPSGVCAMNIEFDLDGDLIRNIKFTGGCNGNLNAISRLCEGMPATMIAEKLKGNDCRGKGTSCADQFSKAILQAVEAEKSAH